MKDSGATVFLATNSDFVYTQAVMTFLFDVELPPVSLHSDRVIYVYSGTTVFLNIFVHSRPNVSQL